jgi:signal transduction histidine kinase
VNFIAKLIKSVRSFNLSNFLDYFIPPEIQVNPEAHRRARMFMLSHVFGPILGNSLPLYLVVMGISRDYRAAVFFFSILAFWIYPFVLRRTARYQLLAFLSVQNLIFCALWACYAYGGINSPFMTWILIFPLLAFLYLPPTGWVRNVLLVQIFGSVGIFLTLVVNGHEFPAIDVRELQVIGMISMAAVATYFAMMSLYFAKMFHEQRQFMRELNGLVLTSDNVRNLITAANQASAAKADFVASMSHELRTPLNAIIGYSQLLIEEATDEDDEESVTDLGHVHKAGSDLLRLIDDILDYSRIEAGKMPVNGSFDSISGRLDRWRARYFTRMALRGQAITLDRSAAFDDVFNTDWDALGSALDHVIAGIEVQKRDARLVLSADRLVDGGVIISVAESDPDQASISAIMINETFDHGDDASPTKYGGTGIEIALAHKFTQLLGGSIFSGRMADGRPALKLMIPDLAQMAPALREAA